MKKVCVIWLIHDENLSESIIENEEQLKIKEETEQERIQEEINQSQNQQADDDSDIIMFGD